MADAQGPLLGRIRIFLRYILRISFVYIVYIPYGTGGKEGKEEERKMSRKVRVSDSVRHAQAQGLARRIQRAAKLRTRHRAGCLVIC